MCRKSLFHKLRDVTFKSVARHKIRSQNNEGFDDFGPERIGLSDSGSKRNSGMFDEAILNLDRTDAIA